MSDIREWSPTDASNNATPPDGFPEGMPASAVNDSSRAVMGGTRRHAEQGGWFDWGDAFIFVGVAAFQVAGDVTSRYQVSRRVRFDQSGTVFWGTIATSVFNTPNTDITVTFPGSETLTNVSTLIALGPEPSATPLDTSQFGTAAFQDVGTAVGNVVQLENVGGPALPAVSGAQLTGLRFELLQALGGPAATLEFVTSAFFTDYVVLRLEVEALLPTNSNTQLLLRASRDGGGTWLAGTNYVGGIQGVNGTGTGYATAMLQDRHEIAFGVNNLATYGVNSRTEVVDIQGRPHMRTEAVWLELATGFGGQNAWSFMNPTGAIDGLQLSFSAGTIVSGVARLYGVRA